MVRISAKKTILAFILSSLFTPAFLSANPLEEYVDMTILEESSHPTTKSVSTDIPNIEYLLKLDHYTRHAELTKMLEEIQKGADNNNRDDLLLLGYYYYSEGEDNDKEEDFIKAKEYFTKAEALGSQDASYLLGDLYYFGEGVSQSYAKAAEYYEKAGQQPQALFSLASLYIAGDGVTEDAKKAVSLYTQSADLQHSSAQHTLGYLYESGDYDAIQPDHEIASQWYQKACDNDESRSCQALKRLSISKLTFDAVFDEIKTSHEYSSESEKSPLMTISSLQSLDDYDQYERLNNYITTLIAETEAGNPDATYMLGLLYQLKADDYYDEYAYGQAKIIFDRAIELGSSDAMFSLAELYYYGNGIDQDYEKSFELYSNPALDQHPEAQFSIGVQYDLGEGVAQSYEKSLEYFKKASALNHDPSTFNVGYMYENGEYVEKDLTEAKKWYQLSCDNGYEEGCTAISYLEDDNMAASEVASPNYQLQGIFNEIMGETEGVHLLELTPASILAANGAEARYFLNQSSETLLESIKNNQDADSLFLMAYLFYLEGQENDDDTLYHQAHALLEKASEAGSTDATFYLGKLSYEGLGTEQSYAQSKVYLEKLIDHNHPEALYYLASIYDEGLETPKDQEKSYNLYLKAAELGHADSTYNVAFMHQYGEYVETDLEVAKSWYEKACQLGDEQGCQQVESLTYQSEDNDYNYDDTPTENAEPEKVMNPIEGNMDRFFDQILDIFAP